MKTFAIFPTITIFILTFTLLRINWELPARKNLFWSFLMASVLGGLLFIFSGEIFFLLYLSNFIFAMVLTPFLIFLINDYFPETTGRRLWLRLFAIGFVAVVITLALFGTVFFYALMNNPMDLP